MKTVFVLMPFDENFDDVFHIIKDSGRQSNEETGLEIKVYRADEIAEPGRISFQVLEAIREADLIIADLTGSNPNVMYELGYAHAAEKDVVILNQEVNDSPFDVKDFRQITYDRTKMLRDCRPRLVTAINSVIGKAGDAKTFIADNDGQVERFTEFSVVRRPGSVLVADIQAIHVKLQVSRKISHDKAEIRSLGITLRKLIDTVTIVGRVDEGDSRNTAGSIGNCAVELEQAGEEELAHEIFTRAINLFPDFEGLRIQYSDFLSDQGKDEEAWKELERAKSINPADRRISRLAMKIRSRSAGNREQDAEILHDLRDGFEADPSDQATLVAYLVALDAAGIVQSEEFERVCKIWSERPGQDGYMADRALADFLAKHDPLRAQKIYEGLLARTPALPDSDRHAVLHNLATILSDTDQDQAIRYWTLAYKMNRTDAVVTASFSQRLAQWGKLDLASRVVNGEQI
ncbi:hypothetical protein GCM10010435_85320 [Winogradskya consettensis]|uniref:DUF4071 domain-containing protein n=1 Tax=Winogradskya consettensis TaxID=113560 RepID=A0A919VNC1_9ACTN|nr:hypothetical protein [Actinoplanes consettensis]GIM72594.1 hypothetical protein Aco04nite_31080 [Actinoplanes consettensis]